MQFDPGQNFNIPQWYVGRPDGFAAAIFIENAKPHLCLFKKKKKKKRERKRF